MFRVTSVRNGRETLIQEQSDSVKPTTFRATYFPRPDDAGIFVVVSLVNSIIFPTGGRLVFFP